MMTPEQQALLLEVARESIRHGLDTGTALPVDPVRFEEALRAPAATFVTLKTGGELRGCIGRLEAGRPLIQDVAENAFAAAFHDFRFSPLDEREWAQLEIHISILSTAEPIRAGSEEELLDALQPGRDGLIIEDGGRRATFLPSVWESLPDKREFLRHLKRKAGIQDHYWSPTLRAYRYHAESFPEPA